MSCLHYQKTQLYIEKVSLKKIAAQFGTPCYIYSRAMLEANWHTFNQAFSIPHRVCYAVKANSNIAILNLFAQLNSGFDTVSQGEIERIIKARGNPKKIIFSGVGKKYPEIEYAIKKGIYCFNVESEPELARLQLIAAKLKKIINIALRINPNIKSATHAYIATGAKENKFGIEINKILPLCSQLSQYPSLRLMGLACHIGSQITTLKPFLQALNHLLKIYHQLKKMHITIQHINMGGGLGIIYHHEHPPKITAYAAALQKKLSPYPLELVIEPGRAIIANAGVLLTQVDYLKSSKQKNFAIIDAGMNDLLRPALYGAWQTILPVYLRRQQKKTYDIAGPVCESADFLGKNRRLALCPGDLLAIDSAGAYGFSMSSNYNSRCRAAEILVDGNQTHLIRRRETIADLIGLETLVY